MRLYNPTSPIDLRTLKKKRTRGLKGMNSDQTEALSDRELEVLEWIVEGLSSKMIAEKLNISMDTVETHRRNILKKTGASNMVVAVVKAFRKGWVG